MDDLCGAGTGGMLTLPCVAQRARETAASPTGNRRHMRNQVKEMGQPNSTISHDIHCARVTLAAIWVEKESPLCTERVSKLA